MNTLSLDNNIVGNTSNSQSNNSGIHPLKFILWLLIVSSIMLFSAFTSAYIVRKGEGNWRIVDLPIELWYSTVVIVISSVTVQLSLYFSKKNDLSKARIYYLLSFGLGLLFLYTQYKSFGTLVDSKFFFSYDNPASSFVYILIGVHAFHLLFGLVFLIIVLFTVFQKNNSINLLRFELCTTYWHFLDAVWVYLFFFLIIYHK